MHERRIPARSPQHASRRDSTRGAWARVARLARAWRVDLVLLGALGTYQLLHGVLPGLALPAGDFANYYTAATLAARGEDLTPAYSDFLWFQRRIDGAGFEGQLGGFIPHPAIPLGKKGQKTTRHRNK